MGQLLKGLGFDHFHKEGSSILDYVHSTAILKTFCMPFVAQTFQNAFCTV